MAERPAITSDESAIDGLEIGAERGMMTASSGREGTNVKRAIATMSVLAGLIGCESGSGDAREIAVEEVPANVMKAAREQLPGVEFETAWAGRLDGESTYEIRGTNAKGATREVRLTASGQLLEKD